MQCEHGRFHIWGPVRVTALQVNQISDFGLGRARKVLKEGNLRSDARFEHLFRSRRIWVKFYRSRQHWNVVVSFSRTGESLVFWLEIGGNFEAKFRKSVQISPNEFKINMRFLCLFNKLVDAFAHSQSNYLHILRRFASLNRKTVNCGIKIVNWVQIAVNFKQKEKVLELDFGSHPIYVHNFS